MNNGLIPHRYAKALYKYAEEQGKARVVYDEMLAVVKSFQDNPGLQRVLSNPNVSNDDKKKLLESAAGALVEDDYRRFVWLILAHGREEFAYQMALAYRDIYRKANHIAQVTITTATELGDAEMDKLKKVVSGAYKDCSLEYSLRVNPDLIGGFVIDVDNVRMDASLSNEIEQLRQNLLRSN